MSKLFKIVPAFVLLANFSPAQNQNMLGLTAGIGMNIFYNHLSTNSSHYNFNRSFAALAGVKALKILGNGDSFYGEFLLERKKIVVKYDFNEPEVPFEDTEKLGQKYMVFSLGLGYRMQSFTFSERFFAETGILLDYNQNSVRSLAGYGSATGNLTGSIDYKYYFNSNLDERTWSAGAKVAAGYSFGSEDQFDISLALNIPFSKIQKNESEIYYEWKYGREVFRHDQKFIGKIYYPTLTLTYYAFR